MMKGEHSMFGRIRVHLFRLISVGLLISMVCLSAQAAGAQTNSLPDFDFITIFGLAAAPDGSLLVADAGAGIVELKNGAGSLIQGLPNATDVALMGGKNLYAITGGGPEPTDGRLFNIVRGKKIKMREVANLAAFEAEMDPDGVGPDSNPFDVETTKTGKILVADAGGNDVLIVNKKGKIDWIATLPDEIVPSDNLKKLIGCPNTPPELAEFCNLPEMMPAQAVATSVAVGPDGAYYVGELKGFPFPLGKSRIWRIEPKALHEECGTSPKCSVVADGFTSIVDLTFGPDGTLYVTEIDEASSGAVELGIFFGIPGLTQGGTVNACNSSTWTCTEKATGLNIPIAAAVTPDGTVYAVINALIPGEATVVTLP
jgi:hypothetical protein